MILQANIFEDFKLCEIIHSDLSLTNRPSLEDYPSPVSPRLAAEFIANNVSTQSGFIYKVHTTGESQHLFNRLLIQIFAITYCIFFVPSH